RLARHPARPRVGAGLPGRHAHRRRARGTAAAQARPAGSDSDTPRRGVQGHFMSLRARLLAAMLAALALTLALTFAVGAVLTRRQVDRAQAQGLSRLADDLAQQRRQHVSYRLEKDTVAGGALVWIAPRATFGSLVPDVNRSSNGKTDYGG